ncbi:hypothetical protein F511_24505 [Dorcoceras hygrometricum]|uniref:Uncharacterized protein n=1 Tax=Dorcoceras hygrometricum TaxID=472368 RepID=A0A2Z7AHY7_9LAMI|nr:hypothetical protein F511_24505 [Dorcoceras hygrometricum]
MRKLAQPTKIIEWNAGEPGIEDYYGLYSEAERYGNPIAGAVMQSPASQQRLTPGRVVLVKSQLAQDHLLGIVIKAPSANYKQYIILVLLPELPPVLQTPSSSGAKEHADFQILVPKTVQQLLILKSDGNKYPPALDPVKDDSLCKWVQQLYKLIDVHEVRDITHLPFAERELMLIKIADVAAVSAGNNYEVGQMIAEMLSKVGRKGVVTLEEGKSA